jgi:hypothetical protein
LGEELYAQLSNTLQRIPSDPPETVEGRYATFSLLNYHRIFYLDLLLAKACLGLKATGSTTSFHSVEKSLKSVLARIISLGQLLPDYKKILSEVVTRNSQDPLASSPITMRLSNNEFRALRAALSQYVARLILAMLNADLQVGTLDITDAAIEICRLVEELTKVGKSDLDPFSYRALFWAGLVVTKEVDRTSISLIRAEI